MCGVQGLEVGVWSLGFLAWEDSPPCVPRVLLHKLPTS